MTVDIIFNEPLHFYNYLESMVSEYFLNIFVLEVQGITYILNYEQILFSYDKNNNRILYEKFAYVGFENKINRVVNEETFALRDRIYLIIKRKIVTILNLSNLKLPKISVWSWSPQQYNFVLNHGR